LIVLPIGWFALLMWLHGRFAPRWHRNSAAVSK
jgi:hypothetical protein